MAWKKFDVSEVPEEELLLVYSCEHGVHLRRFRKDDVYDIYHEYNDNEHYEYPEIQWDKWAKIPD